MRKDKCINWYLRWLCQETTLEDSHSGSALA